MAEERDDERRVPKLSRRGAEFLRVLRIVEAWVQEQVSLEAIPEELVQHFCAEMLHAQPRRALQNLSRDGWLVRLGNARMYKTTKVPKLSEINHDTSEPDLVSRMRILAYLAKWKKARVR